MKSKIIFALLSFLSLLLPTTLTHAYAGYDDDGYYSDVTGSYASDDYYYSDDGYRQAQNSRYYQPNYSYQRYSDPYGRRQRSSRYSDGSGNYSSRLPSSMNTNGEKVIYIDPNKHAWGAYSADGTLVRSGIATAGNHYCPDIRRPCKTRAGTFRIQSLGSASCKSTRYPLGRGGAPMPYCMFFNGNQGLHGSYELRNANVSHGCVRISVDSARWLRHNFANVGTKVVVRPY